MANWPNDKHIICDIDNDIPVKILSHPYVLVNRSILCNFGIEADNHHLLESIASCDKKTTKLIMYFTISLAFTNYLDMLPNMTDSLPLIRDRTQYEQPLPIHLNIPHYDNSLSYRPTKLKDFMINYVNNNNNIKEIFDLQHIFRRDWTTQLIKCMPWSTILCPHPTIIRKMKTFLEWRVRWAQFQCLLANSDPHCQIPTPTLERTMPQRKG